MKQETIFLNIVKNNKYCVIVDFLNENDVKNQIVKIQSGKIINTGYLVIRDYKVNTKIKKYLTINDKLCLLLSKGMLNKLKSKHKISPKITIDCLKCSLTSPSSIVFDKINNSYRFYCKISNKTYRVVYDLDIAPRGILSIKANILKTIFREDKYAKHINKIKKGETDSLYLLYEVDEGWTALVTSSPSGIFNVVASTSREYTSTTLTSKYNLTGKKK